MMEQSTALTPSSPSLFILPLSLRLGGVEGGAVAGGVGAPWGGHDRGELGVQAFLALIPEVSR